MSIHKGKFQLHDSAQWDNVMVNVQTHVESNIKTWIGQLRLPRGRVLLGNEAGELSLNDGRRVSILVTGVTEDLSMSQALYRFLITSPFLSA
jgi:hypothetical protein